MLPQGMLRGLNEAVMDCKTMLGVWEEVPAPLLMAGGLADCADRAVTCSLSCGQREQFHPPLRDHRQFLAIKKGCWNLPRLPAGT